MSLDSKITKEDKELFIKILKIRKDLTNFINLEDFIEEMKKLIKSSKSFDFRSQVAEEYIDKKNPIFKLRVKDDTDLYNDLNFNKMKSEINSTNQPLINSATSKVTDKIYKEIIYNMSDYFKSIIDNDDEIKEIIENIKNENNNLNFNFFLSNMYSIRIGAIDNIIYLTYIM